MKRLFQLLLAAGIILILWFEFQSYRRHRASTAYHFAADTVIDWQYHDPTILKEYLMVVEEVGQYGRYAWSKHGVDVLTDSPTDPRSKDFVQTYQGLVSAARFLEAKLAQSAKWKTEGRTNSEIQVLETGASSLADPMAHVAPLLNNPTVARPTEQGAIIFEIQKKLATKGYTLPIDGIYREETRRSVQEFQREQHLYPSGVVDMRTLEELFR